MKKADLDQVALVVKTAVSEAVQPIHDEVRGHRQTLYGPNGDNGVCGTLKKHSEVIDDYKVKKGQLLVVVAAISAAAGWLSKVIPNPFGR